MRWRASDGRKALSSSRARHKVRRAVSLHSREAHLCQIACRRGAVEIWLRRSARRKRHARARCRAHVLRGLWRLSKVVLRCRALHGRGGHWNCRCIVTDRTQSLAWPAHRKHAAFLRHDERVVVCGVVSFNRCVRWSRLRACSAGG